MALPVVIVASGGLPMNRLSVHGGLPVTLAAQGLAVTEGLPGLGLPMTFVTEGGSIVLPVPPVTYATWSTTDKSANVVLSNGDMTALTSNISLGSARASVGKSSGKFYWEITFVAASSTATSTGLAPAGSALPLSPTDTTKDAAALTGLGAVNVDGAQVIGSMGSVTAGTLVCIAVDLTAKLIWFRLGAAGNWNGNVANNPATAVGGVSIAAVTTPARPHVTGSGSAGQGATANFGASTFVGAVPSGFTSGWPT